MDIYKKRRLEFMKKMDAGVAIITSAKEVLRNSDVHYYFRQDSSFYYLTGFNEPDCHLVLCPGKSEKEILFLREKDPRIEQWTGRRLGVKKAPEVLGLDAAYDEKDFEKKLVDLLSDSGPLYTNIHADLSQFEKALSAIKQSVRKQRGNLGSSEYKDINLILGQMRLYKDDDDIKWLKEAARVNALAHKAAMSFTAPNKNEYEVAALLEFLFKKEGAGAPAYGSIVAGGNNANILHYVENNANLNDGDLLLIDAGPEVNYRASDVTRTFPINGKFSPQQKEVYEIVLEAQKKCLDMIGPNVNFLEDIQNQAIQTLTRGLIDLKVLKGSVEENIEKKAYHTYYPHNIGHWLGMDVHDLGMYRDPKTNKYLNLSTGMCLTIEPGLYLPVGDDNVPKEFQGIGIRIEDDILITSNGFENLTQAIPKEILEVEQACKQELNLQL